MPRRSTRALGWLVGLLRRRAAGRALRLRRALEVDDNRSVDVTPADGAGGANDDQIRSRAVQAAR